MLKSGHRTPDTRHQTPEIPISRCPPKLNAFGSRAHLVFQPARSQSVNFGANRTACESPPHNEKTYPRLSCHSTLYTLSKAFLPLNIYIGGTNAIVILSEDAALSTMAIDPPGFNPACVKYSSSDPRHPNSSIGPSDINSVGVPKISYIYFF